jgi:hypothetical protein
MAFLSKIREIAPTAVFRCRVLDRVFFSPVGAGVGRV